MRRILTIAATVATGLALESGAQAPPATDTAPAKPVSTTLGLVVFPAKGQTQETQATDETSCYAWSKQQTGIDPFAAPTPTPLAVLRASENRGGAAGCLPRPAET